MFWALADCFIRTVATKEDANGRKLRTYSPSILFSSSDRDEIALLVERADACATRLRSGAHTDRVEALISWLKEDQG